jgi:hypothetical protein
LVPPSILRTEDLLFTLPSLPPCWGYKCGDSPGGQVGVTYAIWEVLNKLLLYFCRTPWNKPMGARAGGLSGGAVDLEGAEQE